MNKFNITVIEHNGDRNIYTDATTVNVTNDKIEVARKDDMYEHVMDCVNEIIIKPLV